MKPWSHLSPQQKAVQRREYNRSGASCVNGVTGWYHQKRFKRNWQRPKPAAKVSRFRLIGEITTPDEAPEPITIDDVKELITC